MTDPAPDTASLLFDWMPPQGEKLAIAGFVFLSALLHAACFYLFQITYPPAVSLLSPPARINLITAHSEDGQTVLRWVDAEDPALASATVRPPEAKSRALPKLEHVPSYRTEEPELKHVPPLTLGVRAPSAEPPRPVRVVSEKTETPWPAIPSRTLLSDDLAPLGPPAFPSSKFTASSNEPPEAVKFRIAVGIQGDVRYCFRLNSSGDSALDEQARQHLMLSRFRSRLTENPGDQSLLWGVATMEWGNDVAHSQPTSTPAAP
ncbi:MAG: hypothetical protein QOG67_3544 [Verrucomicrobiota bacterium]|jgi:hypothetical protein